MADLGNSTVFSQTDASNGSGTMPSWSGTAAPSTLDDAGRALQGAVAREWNWRSYTLTASGTNTKVLTYAVAPAAYYNGQRFSFLNGTTVTGATTLNVNSLGAKTIKKVVAGVLTDLASGDMVAGAFVEVAYYQPSDCFVWVNQGYVPQALGTGDTPQFVGIEVGNASDTTLTRSSAGVLAVEGKTLVMNGTGESLTIGTIELGALSDTTISRSSAGVIAVEGKTVVMNGTGESITTGTIELGAASDTTISRSSAGVIAVEGVTVPLNSTSSVHTAQQIELGNASDTTITRSAAGVIAVEGGVVPKENRANTFSVDQVINANLGLGVTPSYKLDVAGDMRLQRAATDDAAIYFGSTTATQIYGGPAANILAFNTSSSERLRIGASGQLGIGGANYGASGEILTSNGSSAAPSWQSVGASTAGLSAGSVGSYAYLRFNTLTTASADSTHAGSGLRYSNSAGGTTGGAPSGTWRLMGATDNGSTGLSTSLFLRIS